MSASVESKEQSPEHSSVYLCEPFDPPKEFSLEVPGSKSHANRAIVAACLAKGTTVLENALTSDDTDIIVLNLQKIGFAIECLDREKGILRITGGLPAGGSDVLHFNNAGTPLRLVSSVAALVPGEWTITGSERMLQRPIADLVNALRQLGAEVEDTHGKLPIRIKGGTISGGSVTLDASKSSQFLSSLLLIAPRLDEPLRVSIASHLTSPGYVELTERVMHDFGITTKHQDGVFEVDPGSYTHTNSPYQIEGDWSGAGAFLALAAIKKAKAIIPNVREDSLQSDRLVPSMLEQLKNDGDVTLDCTDIPDQVMNIALAAAHREGATTIIGAKNLRGKECDRLAVLCEQFSKAGINIAEHDDGVIIQGTTNPRYGRAAMGTDIVMDPYDDHRMAMCFAMFGSHHAGISIKDPHCVSKSYPHFYRDLESLRPENSVMNNTRKAVAEIL